MNKREAYLSAGCDRTPQPLAEHLPPLTASAAMKHFETRRNPEGLFRSAWHNAEYALNRSIALPDEARVYQLDSVQNLLGWVMSNPETHADTQLGALVLSSYVPLLSKRAFEEEITPGDCRQLYDSLGSAIRYLRPTSDRYPPPWRMTETAVLAAAARTSRPELLLYPASPREEASVAAEFNHDSYFVANNAKIPIQQKLIDTDHQYDDEVSILTLEPLMKKAYKKSRLSAPASSSEQLNHILALIVSETSGQRLSRTEQQFLNAVSEAVAHHYVRAVRSD